MQVRLERKGKRGEEKSGRVKTNEEKECVGSGSLVVERLLTCVLLACVHVSCVFRLLPAPMSLLPAGAVTIAEEESAIAKSKVNVRICRPCIFLAPADALKKATGGNDAELAMVVNFVASLEFTEWRSAAKDVEVTIDGKKVVLKYGKHMFPSAAALLEVYPATGVSWLK